ncbi:nardilysin-like [Onthophagus taurus]|uniref:nardilysin-like n=1 Tax=Onthophagus taurus TaxID=166361 RepID=UPI000C20FC10|nr:nardilysin-like [Onthophagus taurus]
MSLGRLGLNVLKKLSQNSTRNTITSFRLFSKDTMTKKRASKVNSGSRISTASAKSVQLKNYITLNTPIKSASDNKSYRVIRLENGLTACLISDLTEDVDLNKKAESDSESEYETDSEGDDDAGPISDLEASESEHEGPKMKKVSNVEQKMAAAALSINVGSFSDPLEVPGLAHFLEHMVFMGSKKYPRENEFDSFIKKRGGSDNASTDCELTTFHFETMDKHLFNGLDRFAQFFIDPLMHKESMTREREAIESEFQIALPSDNFRKEQLLMSLFNPEVPICTFSWGNLKTLKDNINDDDLYLRLHEFRKRHYSAHRMTLAIQGRFSLDTLQSFVLNCFSNVQTNNEPPIDFTVYQNKIFNTPNFKQIYYVEPVKDITQLDIVWVLPPQFHLYKCKPQQYLSWLLGHEGKGSLLSYLKKKLWGLAVYCGNDDSGSNSNSIYYLFTMNIVLTKEGLNAIDKVIEAIYSYIKMLVVLGPQKRIYDEIKLVEEVSFKFREEEVPADYVESLVENMHYYPPEHYIAGPELYFEYDPKAIQDTLTYLNVNNMNVMVSTPVLPVGIDYDHLEPWFETNYAIQNIPDEWKSRWANVEVFKEMHLPDLNQFLTNDFSLLPTLEPKMAFPQKIIDDVGMEIWYKKDDKFNFPVARYCYTLLNPIIVESPLGASLTDIFVTLLGIQLAEEVYPAISAELDYSITVGDTGIMLRFYGYNEKLPTLGVLIAKYLKNVHENLTPELVAAVKEKQLKYYHNRFLKPNNLAKDLRLSVLCNGHWTSIEKHTALLDATFEMVQSFSKDLVCCLHIQGLIQGNVSEKVARDTTMDIVNVLQFKMLPINNIRKMIVNKIPISSEHAIRTMSFNQNDSNSIITNYYQCDSSELKDFVLIELILMMAEERAFDKLRTKEQLGYNVYTTVRDTFGILGFSITVNAQATKNTTDYIDKRIEAFMDYMNKSIKKMPDNKMNQVKRDLIKLKRMADTELEEEAERNWSEIWSREYLFDREEREAKIIEELKNSEIRKFFEDHTTVGSKRFLRKLSVQVVGHKEKDDRGRSKRSTSPGDPTPGEEKKFSINLLGPIGNEETPEEYFIRDVLEYRQRCEPLVGKY